MLFRDCWNELQANSPDVAFGADMLFDLHRDRLTTSGSGKTDWNSKNCLTALSWPCWDWALPRSDCHTCV